MNKIYHLPDLTRIENNDPLDLQVLVEVLLINKINYVYRISPNKRTFPPPPPNKRAPNFVSAPGTFIRDNTVC